MLLLLPWQREEHAKNTNDESSESFSQFTEVLNHCSLPELSWEGLVSIPHFFFSFLTFDLLHPFLPLSPLATTLCFQVQFLDSRYHIVFVLPWHFDRDFIESIVGSA